MSGDAMQTIFGGSSTSIPEFARQGMEAGFNDLTSAYQQSGAPPASQLPGWMRSYFEGSGNAGGYDDINQQLAANNEAWRAANNPTAEDAIPFGPDSQAAMDALRTRGQFGNEQGALSNYVNQSLGLDMPSLAPGIGAAGDIMSGQGLGQGQLGATAGGGFLGSNPYLDSQVNAAMAAAGRNFQEATLPAIDTMFGQGGRSGSGMHQAMYGRAMDEFARNATNTAGQIYGSAYESERDRMLGAAGQLGNQQLAGIGALGDMFGLTGAERARGAAGLTDLANLGQRGIDNQLLAGGAMDQLMAARNNFNPDVHRFQQWMSPFAPFMGMEASSQSGILPSLTGGAMAAGSLIGGINGG